MGRGEGRPAVAYLLECAIASRDSALLDCTDAFSRRHPSAVVSVLPAELGGFASFPVEELESL